MKRFNQFVTEGTLTTTQFPHAAQSRAGQKYLQKVIDAINTARQTGSIPNPEFNYIKGLANSVLEGALDKPESLIVTVFRDEKRREFTLWDLDGGIPYANTIAGRLKRAKAAKPTSDGDRAFLAWLIPILTELEPLAAAIMDLKDIVVKRAIKTDAEKAAEKQKFIAPMQSSEAGRIVSASLKKMSDELKQKYVDSIAKWWWEIGTQFEALDKAEQERKRSYYGDVLGVRDAWVGSYREQLKLSPKAKSAFKVAAQRVGDDMQAAFIYKNAAKLVAILVKAGQLSAEPKIQGLSADRGIFEGEMVIAFKSGAKFTVRNKVVIKSNSYGTVFNQFPTTFHDVTCSDGSKLPAPSEERMNTAFF